MKVKQFSTVTTTTNTTYFSDPILLEMVPYHDTVTLQFTHIGSSATSLSNTITLQCRAYPDMAWVDCGSGFSLAGSNAATVTTGGQRQFVAPEYRIKVVRSTAAAGTTGTVNGWICR